MAAVATVVAPWAMPIAAPTWVRWAWAAVLALGASQRAVAFVQWAAILVGHALVRRPASRRHG